MVRKVLSEFITELFETPSQYSHWLGYYNYDALNIDRNKILSQRASIEAKAVSKGDIVEVGYFDLETREWHKVDISDSWNWPQAAMVQWLPDGDQENRIIYNLSRDGHLIARIFNIDTGVYKDIDWSIYGITPDGKKSIALNMERSYWCRAYHYQSVVNASLNVPIPAADGIFEIDLEKNTRRLIVDIHDVIKLDADEDFPNLKHWFEHIMINPSGTKFCFLHRFSPVNNAMQYQTRLCIANIDGSGTQVIPGWRDYSLSHFGWQNDDNFVIYSVTITDLQKSFLKSIKQEINHKKSSIGSLKTKLIIGIKNIIPRKIRSQLKGGSSANFYQYYILMNNKYTCIEKWNQPIFNIDGHPSFTKDGRYMITDTYADPKAYRRLIVYDLHTKKHLVLGKFYEPLVGNPARCDLHPKLCRDNNFVAVDTTNSGKHQTLLFKLEWDKIKNIISR